MKYFVIGFSKCGTTSLNRYFKENDLRTLHYFNTYEEIIEMEGDTFIKKFRRRPRYNEFIGLVMKNNYKNNKPLFENILDFDAMTQMDFSGGCDDVLAFFPQINLLEEILLEYPDAKFVFNERDIDKWYKSLVKWYSIHKYYAKSNIPGLNGSTKQDFHKLFNYHKTRVIKLFIQYNKLDNLLFFDIERDNIEKLNNFTGLHKLKIFPNLNKNDIQR